MVKKVDQKVYQTAVRKVVMVEKRVVQRVERVEQMVGYLVVELAEMWAVA